MLFWPYSLICGDDGTEFLATALFQTTPNSFPSVVAARKSARWIRRHHCHPWRVMVRGRFRFKRFYSCTFALRFKRSHSRTQRDGLADPSDEARLQPLSFRSLNTARAEPARSPVAVAQDRYRSTFRIREKGADWLHGSIATVIGSAMLHRHSLARGHDFHFNG